MTFNPGSDLKTTGCDLIPTGNDYANVQKPAGRS